MILSESKPIVLLKKYRSILFASLAVEIVTFIVSLTDSVVAANLIGLEALSAISLFSPFLLISSFVASVINTGTLVNYSLEIGRFHQKRANEFFSQGIMMAVVFGILMTVIVFLIKPLFLSNTSVTPAMETYLKEYYNIAALYLLLFPVSCVLNNIVVADGGERLAAFANISCIVGNIVLSLVLAKPCGVVGIASATLICKIGFVFLICLWFFKRNNHIRFVFCFAWADFLNMIGRGIVRASKFAALSLMLWIVNLYVLQNYDIVTFQVWTVDQNILGFSTVFFGLSMTLQPLVGTLLGENNTKAIRILVRRLSRDLAVISAICTIILLCFTPLVLYAFGIREGAVFNEGVAALRITGLTVALSAQMELFFVYYFLINKQLLALAVGLLKELICPVGIVLVAGMFRNGEPNTLWVCLTASVVLSAVISSIIVLARYKKSAFPLLLPCGQDEKIHIYGFAITAENASAISKSAGKLLQKEGFAERVQVLIGVCLEDMINLIIENNSEFSKDLFAECTVTIEDDGVQVILRDNGKHFDISEDSAKDYSFLKYTVDRLITVADHNAYIATTGYNRNELFLEDKRMTSK